MHIYTFFSYLLSIIRIVYKNYLFNIFLYILIVGGHFLKFGGRRHTKPFVYEFFGIGHLEPKQKLRLIYDASWRAQFTNVEVEKMFTTTVVKPLVETDPFCPSLTLQVTFSSSF